MSRYAPFRNEQKKVCSFGVIFRRSERANFSLLLYLQHDRELDLSDLPKQALPRRRQASRRHVHLGDAAKAVVPDRGRGKGEDMHP